MVEEQKYPDFAARLNGLISRRDISITQLSEKTGVTYEMVRRYTLGTAKPRTPTMRKLSAVLGVDAAYLEYGVGKPSESEAMKPIASNPFSDVYRVEVLDLTVSAGPGNYMISDYVEVLYAIEFTTEHARVLFGNRDPTDVKVMTVNGDSMAPTLVSGDRLFVDTSVRHFQTDGVYSFVYGKTFHVKRLQMQGDKLAVLSDNPAYEKWYINEDSQDNLYVMGKALIHESIKYNRL
ncbi:XRE family transcriptional regulator [Klebsiella pneumoniae]|uniref:XRE family transcriptional regulator n=1 Tax=Klebsiella pneumoniae TaxID=573 RepID=UPI000577F8A2|nr:XRE family transcriptional regulator [Klebsiella pneumoniae]MBK0533736.1 helix-turn-helix transcriptional regulator [Klebsiella pneumoniae]MBK4943299.1 helix-turn-helix transcriptional regulator [Klebsiella pneumoniae]TWV16794.1 helix-turn-helix transcriptional regulator [Klebsiella pneumoniae]HBQ6921507.1 helix-turn-helix transcriptional regulator [Klebsiella pneumoniae]HBR5588414.1 helix-turn-helix transcriptional regulator [Klebsiella pneumoniae]